MTRGFELDDQYSLRVPSDPQLSPDGRSVAHVQTDIDAERDAWRTTIWSVAVDGFGRERLTPGGSDSRPRWSPDGRTLAFLSAAEDGKAPQIWLLSPANGEVRRLTDLPGGAGEPVWSPTGDRIAFTQAARYDPESTEPIVVTRLGYRADGVGFRPTIGDHLFVVDVASGATTKLVDGATFGPTLIDYMPLPVWSPDGSRIARSWADDPADLTFTLSAFVVPSEGGRPQRVTDPDGFLLVEGWAPEGDELILRGQEHSEDERRLYRLYAAPTGGGAPRRLTPDLDRSVVLPSRVAPDGERILFGVNDRGSTHVYAIDRAGGAPVAVIDGPSSVAGFSLAGDRIAAVVADGGTTGEIEILGLDGTGRSRLTGLFASDLPDVQAVEPEERRFRAADGAEVHGWVFRPRADGPTPLLLSVHGGPHMSWGPVLQDWSIYHQAFASHGWTVLLVNPRGSDGYGEEFLGTGSWGTHDDGDLLAAVDALIAEGLVDPDRVAVTGYSYGGYMTCLLTARHDRFRAAVAGGTIVDLPEWSSDAGSYYAERELDSDPWSEPDRWREVSPITHAPNVRCPTLLVHGANDDRCPFEQAEAWFLALRAHAVPVELVRYPGANHFVFRPSQRLDYHRRMEDWLTRHCSARGGEALDA